MRYAWSAVSRTRFASFEPGQRMSRPLPGSHHLPLGDLLNAIAGSGFTIEHVEEPGDTDPPFSLALRVT